MREEPNSLRCPLLGPRTGHPGPEAAPPWMGLPRIRSNPILTNSYSINTSVRHLPNAAIRPVAILMETLIQELVAGPS